LEKARRDSMRESSKLVGFLLKTMTAFLLLYVMPFATVIILMASGYIDAHIGISALLTLALIYLTGFQVELALRNAALRELEVQPILRVKLGKGFVVAGRGEEKEVILRNEGKYPAIMVTVGIITRPGVNIEKYKRETIKDMLVPGEEITIMTYDDSLKQHEIRLNILYKDMMDRDRFVMFIKPRNYEIFIPIGSPVDLERGVLIRTVEKLFLLRTYLRFRAQVSEHTEKQ
jgi:hypothetical protein